VTGGTAYRADPVPGATHWVECESPGQSRDVIIDHHRPGDPDYGRPPAEFLAASSIGQVIIALDRLGMEPWWNLTDTGRADVMLTAAADHCLGAAYRGECPGVDPDELMRWRISTRAAHQGRSESEILGDVERAREALREAPVEILGLEVDPESYEPDPYHPIACRDMRALRCWERREVDGGGEMTAVLETRIATSDPWDRSLLAARGEVSWPRGGGVPELPEAAAREGRCFISSITDRDGRVKVVCQAGSPEQIHAFLDQWAPIHGLVDTYGDPARGFAGGYLP
jgi:hypothetical protein